MVEVRRQVLRGLAVAAVLACLSLSSAFALEVPPFQTEPTAEEPIPFKPQRTPSAGSLSRILFVFLLTVGGVIGAAVVLKRNLQKKGVISVVRGTRIKVSETKRISPKITVFLVAVDGTDYLMVRSGEQIQIARHDRNMVVESGHES